MLTEKIIKAVHEDIPNINSQLEQLTKNKITYINIKSLGAKGDGKTDDTQVFKNALSKPDVVLYLPIGDYLIKETIMLDSKQKIIGEHFSRSLIIYDGVDGTNALESKTDTIYCEFENFKLVRSNRTKKGYGIYMNFVSNPYEYDSKHKFKQVWIDGFERNFFITMPNRGCTFENCLSTNCSYGYEYSTDTVLFDCGALRCDAWGFRGYNSNQLTNCKPFLCTGGFSVTGSNNLLNVQMQQNVNGFYVVGDNNIITCNIDMMNDNNVADSRAITHDGNYNIVTLNIDNTNGNLKKIISNNQASTNNVINVNYKNDKSDLTPIVYPTEAYLKNNLVTLNGVQQNRNVWLSKSNVNVTVGSEYDIGVNYSEIIIVPIVKMSNNGEKYISITFPSKYMTLYGSNGSGSWTANATVTLNGNKFTVNSANNDSGAVTSLRCGIYYKI